MFRLLSVLVLSFAVSSQAIAAVKWNNSSSGTTSSDDEVNVSKILPSKISSNYFCEKEIESYVNDVVTNEEKFITDERLNSNQDIMENEDFFNNTINYSLYNRTALVIQQPKNLTASTDLKALLKQIGISNFATKVNKKKSAQRLLQTDFLLLYTYAVIALDETGNLSKDEKKAFIEHIKKRINLRGISSSYTYKGSECTKQFLGEDKFDVFSCQNHAYGKHHLRMLVGVLTNNKKEIDKGRKLYKFAIDDLGHTGALWREASRGAYSWTYYPHALGSLMAIGDIDKQLGGNLFTYSNKKGQTIHDAVNFYIESLQNPTNPELMWKYALKNMGIDKPRKDWNKPKSLNRHKRVLDRPDYSEWFPIYAYNFREHQNVNAFKEIIEFNPYDLPPEFTYHLGLNSWCSYDYGKEKCSTFYCN